MGQTNNEMITLAVGEWVDCHRVVLRANSDDLMVQLETADGSYHQSELIVNKEKLDSLQHAIRAFNKMRRHYEPVVDSSYGCQR